MNELCLFAGAGGGLLATQHLLGFRTICYVEIDRYCVEEILVPRIRDGLLDDAPIWDDVRTFDGKPWRGCVDIVTAGFPCQPFSTAGKRLASRDRRNLWPHTVRVVNEIQPTWVLLENVPGLLSGTHGYFGTVLRDLAKVGFDARWGVLSAAGCGAPHLRKRLWIVTELADTERDGRQQGAQVLCRRESESTTCGEDVDDPDSGRHGTPEEPVCPGWNGTLDASWWASEPDVGRVANGVASRVDRLKALGNGQVPIVVAKAWELLSH